MEDSVSEPYNVRAITMTGSKQNEDQSVRSQYSMPGILHFLQTEWTRYEADRIQWDVDRAELQTKVAFLQGERKAQENLKRDLVRRIKMLEFALRQERSKYHHLKFGTDMETVDMIPPSLNDDNKDQQIVPNVDPASAANNNVGFYKQGHQILRQYLQEIGYTDTIIDVRSARIRQMLGLPVRDNKDDLSLNGVKNDLISGKRPIETQGSRANVKKIPQSLMESAQLNEESVLSNFDFLACENGEEPFVDNDDNDNVREDLKNNEQLSNQNDKVNDCDDIDDMMADVETEDALCEFDFLVTEDNDRFVSEQSHRNNTESSENGIISSSEDWKGDSLLMNKIKETRHDGRKSSGHSRVTDSGRPSRSALKEMLVNLENEADSPALQSGLHSPPHHSDGVSLVNDAQHKGLSMLGENNVLDGSLGLGELADLNVNNEGDSPIHDVLDGTDFHRKAWSAKYSLRSHFDAIRAVVFHPFEPMLLTAGEDEVVKLWNLQKAVPGKKATSVDMEPVCTFRAHTGPVLCLTMNTSGKMCYSGATDGTICCWSLPNANTEVYDSYDESILQSQLKVHQDAIWSLTVSGSRMLSCSADGTAKLWNIDDTMALLNTFTVDTESATPNSIDFVRSEPDQMVMSFSSSKAYVFDMEKSKAIVTLDCSHSSGVGQINRIITHPTLPVTVVAHDDRHLRFFDNNTGKVIHSMVAHLDAITSLALDPSGLYLLTGSHDCSMRLWNLETKTCIQEISAHRKKFDESIHDVAFHPSKPFIASVGADGVAKVFV